MNTNTTPHTPGPWNVGDDSPNDYEGSLIDTRDRVLAVITIEDATEPTPEDRANARLIAAAPEMLHALQYAREILATAKRYFPKSVKNGDKFSLLNAEVIIDKAITKATGSNS